MKRLAAILALLLACAAGCGNERAAPDDGATVAARFAYDTDAPLRFVDRGRINRDYPIAVDDVSYSRPDGSVVDGFLVVPPGSGPFPGVVYLHAAGGDRTQLLVPATWLAARGVVALTITTPTVTLDSSNGSEAALRRERDAAVAAVVAARRAVDVLQSLPSVDASRIGLVGWSAGARTGAIVAGVDARIRAFDLISGGATPIAEYANEAPADLREALVRELGAVDPLQLVALARPGTILLQNGRNDTVVPRSALEALATAAGAAAELRWYDHDHAPTNETYHDGLEWLAAKLGVGGPIVPGANAGP